MKVHPKCENCMDGVLFKPGCEGTHNIVMELTQSEALNLLIAVGNISGRTTRALEAEYKYLYKVPDNVEIPPMYEDLELFRDLKSIWDPAFRRNQ